MTTAAADQLALLFGTPFDRDLIVTPFLLEIVLRSGGSYYVHSLALYDKDDDLMIFLVWDLRAFDDNGIAELMDRLNQVFDMKALADHEKIHPKLDWGFLSVSKQDIICNVEWHDRYWPVEFRERRERLGFRLPTTEDPSKSAEEP